MRAGVEHHGRMFIEVAVEVQQERDRVGVFVHPSACFMACELMYERFTLLPKCVDHRAVGTTGEALAQPARDGFEWPDERVGAVILMGQRGKLRLTLEQAPTLHVRIVGQKRFQRIGAERKNRVGSMEDALGSFYGGKAENAQYAERIRVDSSTIPLPSKEVTIGAPSFSANCSIAAPQWRARRPRTITICR